MPRPFNFLGSWKGQEPSMAEYTQSPDEYYQSRPQMAKTTITLDKTNNTFLSA